MIKKIFYSFLFFNFTILCSQTVVTIQPNSEVGKDAYIHSIESTTNYGTDSKLSLHVDEEVKRRSYIFFDVSSIPSNAIVIDARLYLCRTETSPSGAKTTIEIIDESWEENEITWANVPSLISTPSTITEDPSNGGGYWEYFEVKDHAQHFVNYTPQNLGWRLKCRDEINSLPKGATYHSSDAESASLRPYLRITFVRPIEITLNQITHAEKPNSSDGSISISVSEGDGNYTYRWIEGSTGNVIGTNSSSINSLSPGWYGVEVEDGSGNIAYKAFIVGAECGIVQIAFQPDKRFTDDSYIMKGIYPNSQNPEERNFSNISFLFSENYYDNGSPLYDYTNEFLFRNRLIIPNNIKLISAQQKFYGFNHLNITGNNSALYLNGEDWQENVVTYNTKPIHNLSSNDLLSSTSSSTENKVLDHTTYYTDLQLGNANNYGYTVELDYSPLNNDDREMSFYSSDYGDEDFRPKLTIIVGTPCSSVKLSRKLDGNYYPTVNQQLFVEYNEPYQIDNPSDIEYRILNQSGLEVSNGTALQNVILNREINVLSFDFSGNGNCLSTGYYTLEVFGPKGDKRVLRFYHENTGC